MVKNQLNKYIGYNDDDVIRPLCITLHQIVAYAKSSNNNNDNNNNNKIWEQISNLLNKEFDSEPVYGFNDKHISTKIKQ